jgi:thioredoxin-related protein
MRLKYESAVGGGVFSMKKSVIMIIALFAAGILLINGFKGSSADSGEWQDGIHWAVASTDSKDIAADGKPVYLFVSTDWCTFCKKMKSETFSDARVQKLLNELFVPITIDPEKPGTASFTGRELAYDDLAKELGVTGYPANFFFDSEGKLLGSQPGYIDAKTFADLVEFIGDGHYTSKSFSEFQALPADKRR